MTISFRHTTRIAVEVTFLRLEPGQSAAVKTPLGDSLVEVPEPTIEYYRYLYNSVGQAHCWWLRRMMSDADLAALLADPAVSIHVLYRGGQPAGFYELDGRGARDVNISYFGLLPQALGRGIGRLLLDAAITDARARSEAGTVRVNTCTADHPRALPNYLRAGFQRLRTVPEIWDIPDRLGLTIPDRLRV